MKRKWDGLAPRYEAPTLRTIGSLKAITATLTEAGQLEPSDTQISLEMNRIAGPEAPHVLH